MKPDPNELPVNAVASPVQVGPYHLALLIASSFGKFLPAIAALFLLLALTIGLIYGAWVSIDKITTLQTSLFSALEKESEAKIALARATADAEAIGNKARYETLQDYSEKLRKLNEVSADFSKKLQDLISGQLVNMQKNEEITRTQNEKTSRYQADIENRLKADLNVLQQKINETSKAIGQQKMDEYRNLKSKVASLLKERRIVDDGVLDLLQQRFSDPEQLEQAAADINNEQEPWGVRVTLALEIFRQSGDEKFLKTATTLLGKNAGSLDYTFASLLTRRMNLTSRSDRLLPVVAAIVLDSNYAEEFRNYLLDSQVFSPYGYANKNPANLLSADMQLQIAKYAAQRLYTVNAQNETECYNVSRNINPISFISQEAALVYGFRAIERQGINSVTASCITKELERSGSAERPGLEAFNRWPG